MELAWMILRGDLTVGSKVKCGHDGRAMQDGTGDIEYQVRSWSSGRVER